MILGEPFGGIIPGARGAVLAALLRTGTPLTGRQVHRLVSDNHSLWTVQETLKTLVELGLISTERVGRASIHTVNQEHAAVAPLRAMLSPVTMLRDTVEALVGNADVTVILFGSIARGESTPRSDVDLAVIAPEGWDKRVELEDAVRARLGNDCEVLVFTPNGFADLRASGEPIVSEILRDGMPLVGSLPKTQPTTPFRDPETQ